jgi:hypothetical protein
MSLRLSCTPAFARFIGHPPRYAPVFRHHTVLCRGESKSESESESVSVFIMNVLTLLVMLLSFDTLSSHAAVSLSLSLSLYICVHHECAHPPRYAPVFRHHSVLCRGESKSESESESESESKCEFLFGYDLHHHLCCRQSLGTSRF